jgi:uncharacterized protein (TIGR00369 family)
LLDPPERRMTDRSDKVPTIPLHDLLDLRFDFDDSEGTSARVTMPVAEGALGANGNLHGGAIATAVDLASALAGVRSRPIDFEVESLITTDLHVRYLGRPRTEVVTVTAEVVRAGRQLIVIACSVTDGDGHLVASADVGMMVVPRRRPLTDDAG